jgi:prefoldin alpha subunit
MLGKKLSRKIEEDFRKISTELRILEQNVETLQSRINMINTVITDVTYANMTLEGLEKQEKNAELLIPIGGSSYIKAKLGTSDKITVGLGAGVSVEKTLQEAKEIISKRLEELEKTKETFQQQLLKVVERINQNKGELETLAGKLQQETSTKNV